MKLEKARNHKRVQDFIARKAIAATAHRAVAKSGNSTDY